jgi:nucleoid-associated protein YgaU
MALVKLKILVEVGQNRFEERITALFNPNQISLQKTANWRLVPAAERDVPASQFTHGDPTTLTMDLFFDTYEAGDDVRRHTQQIAALTTIEQHGNIHRPPICQLLWGQAGVFFQGVLQSLNQRFTLFLPDGTPVRATLGCTFREWRSDEEEERRLKKESVDVAKTRTVRRGDRLSAIAADEYHDPALWRAIARANGITNPRVLEPGRVLALPALRGPRAPGRER